MTQRFGTLSTSGPRWGKLDISVSHVVGLLNQPLRLARPPSHTRKNEGLLAFLRSPLHRSFMGPHIADRAFEALPRYPPSFLPPLTWFAR